MASGMAVASTGGDPIRHREEIRSRECHVLCISTIPSYAHIALEIAAEGFMGEAAEVTASTGKIEVGHHPIPNAELPHTCPHLDNLSDNLMARDPWKIFGAAAEIPPLVVKTGEPSPPAPTCHQGSSGTGRWGRNWPETTLSPPPWHTTAKLGRKNLLRAGPER